jgi:hypothetical protein
MCELASQYRRDGYRHIQVFLARRGHDQGPFIARSLGYIDERTTDWPRRSEGAALACSESHSLAPPKRPDDSLLNRSRRTHSG